MRADDMAGCAETAKRAIEAARAAGAKDAEADASVSLGSSLSYLAAGGRPGRAARRAAARARTRRRSAPASGRRRGPAGSLTDEAGFAGAERAAIALRAYINLSDVLELLGRHAEAAQTAAEGIELATRAGMTRTLGSYLIGNRADSLLRMGQLDEADELTAQALATLPEGVFSATLHQLRAEIAVMRGRYDEAAASDRATRRLIGDTTDVQFTQTLRYTAGMIALGTGDIGAARAGGHRGAARDDKPLERALRLAAALAGHADRGRRRDQAPGPQAAAPGGGHRPLRAARRPRRPGAGPGPVRGRPTASSPPPSTRGPRATDTPATWLAAVTAWRRRCRAVPAVLRAAPAGRGAHRGGRPGRPRPAPSGSRTRLARRLGAAPIAAEAEALARRARLSLPQEPAALAGGGRRARPAAGGGPRRAGHRGEARRRAGPLRPHRPRARGPHPGRRRPVQPGDRPGAVHQREDRQRARLQHPRQAGRQRPGRGRRGRPPPRRHRLAVTATRQRHPGHQSPGARAGPPSGAAPGRAPRWTARSTGKEAAGESKAAGTAAGRSRGQGLSPTVGSAFPAVGQKKGHCR